MANCEINELVTKCNIIKISPSLEDSLQAMGLDMELDIQIVHWFNHLMQTWKVYKKNPSVQSHVEEFFRSRTDPFRIALLFVLKCEEFKDSKPKTLPYFIMETLLKFSFTDNVYSEDSLKMPAFHLAMSQRSQHFFNLVVKAYKLETIKELVVPIVNDMIKNDNCRQASQIVVAMGLFELIPVEKLLFPLILQDKSNMIDEYLMECPTQVKPLLKFLDKLLDKNFKTTEFIQNYVEENNISQVRYEKMHYKPLGKLVARLCNKFNVPIESCENLSKNRTTSGLRYLIYQKYVANNVSSTVWDDLVNDSLKEYPDSAVIFIDMLVDHDKNEALKWARQLNIPDKQLPLAIRGNPAPKNLEVIQDSEENWDADDKSNEQDYYKSPLKRDQIIIVDSAEKFINMLNTDLVHQEVVSLDCEWKPSFGAKQSQVAIMQIGTPNKAYLIDTIHLNKQEYQALWQSFNKSFLDNAEIIKLGFGLEQDLREMKTTIVGLSSIKVKGEGFLDLSTLWKSLLNHKISLPGNGDSGASLSSVAQTCFGKPLEKSEQCSNWELRPLRESQIEYAALDAHILLQIYYFLQKQCQEQEIEFEDICNDVMVESKKKATKKPKVIDRMSKSFSQAHAAKAAKDIRFILEPFLSYLLSYLRYCGIDTCVTPTTNMLWHEMINLAISEDRYVLTVKPKISPTINYPQSSILCVGKVPVLKQLHSILDTYKVKIEKSDLMSICLYCNSKEMRKLNPDEVHHICLQSEKNVEKSYARYDEEDKEEDYYSNFISDSEDEEIHHFLPEATSSNSTYKTSKGAVVKISDPQKLKQSKKSAILCEACGKLYSNDDDLLKSVNETIFKIINLRYSFD